jgi:hypothetical protein
MLLSIPAKAGIHPTIVVPAKAGIYLTTRSSLQRSANG